MKVILALVLAAVLSVAAACNRKPETVCYKNLGCFTDAPPFDDRPLPDTPNDIAVKFWLYTRENPKKPDRMTPEVISMKFDRRRPTVVVVHGWMSGGHNYWLPQIKDELLKHGDYNVLLTDWFYGATRIWYPQSASNTRVVGATIAHMLRNLRDFARMKISDVHLIGHSLGAHTCGYAGKALNGELGRISGLDPAGPWFWDLPEKNRLSADDAKLVDVIHTDGNYQLLLKLGIGLRSGDVDFYPNGGYMQPGCLLTATNNQTKAAALRANPDDTVGWTPDEIEKIVACSHSRSHDFYTESINSKCLFLSKQCRDPDAAYDGSCDPCSGDDCPQRMGFHANSRPGRGAFHLKTNGGEPYCYL